MASITFNQANGTTVGSVDAHFTGDTTLFEVQSSVLQITNSSTFVTRYTVFSNAQGGTQESTITLKAGVSLGAGEIISVLTQGVSTAVNYEALIDNTNVTLRRNNTFQSQTPHGMTLASAGNTVRLRSNSSTGLVDVFINGSGTAATSFTDGTPLTGGFPGFMFNAQGTIANVGITAWTDGVAGTAQISHRNGIALSGISAINGITKTGISAINGLTI